MQHEHAAAWDWCVLNAWGWPKNEDKPDSGAAREARAQYLMDTIQRTVGLKNCLEVWNSAAFKSALQTITREYGEYSE